jgi:hypothetical protein
MGPLVAFRMTSSARRENSKYVVILYSRQLSQTTAQTTKKDGAMDTTHIQMHFIVAPKNSTKTTAFSS